MTVRNPIRFVLALFFGFLLIGVTVAVLMTPHSYAAEPSDILEYHCSRVSDVASDGLVSVGNLKFYADGFSEGQTIHYQTLNGEVVRASATYEGLINQTF